jgi:hypothetical protein
MGWPGDPMKPRGTTKRRACSDRACTRSAVTPAIAAACIARRMASFSALAHVPDRARRCRSPPDGEGRPALAAPKPSAPSLLAASRRLVGSGGPVPGRDSL